MPALDSMLMYSFNLFKLGNSDRSVEKLLNSSINLFNSSKELIILTKPCLERVLKKPPLVKIEYFDTIE